MKVQVDADHAGDTVTMRSTTGMIAFYGRRCMKDASNAQSTIALSTGESEYYALVKRRAAGLRLQPLLPNFNFGISVRVFPRVTAMQPIGQSTELAGPTDADSLLVVARRMDADHLKICHAPGKEN